MIATQLTQAKSLFPQISLREWSHFCCSGNLPASVMESLARGGFLADLIRFAQLIGGLEPLAVSRPGACDPVIVVERDIHVPPATLNDDGVTVTASEERVFSFCAPMNRALMISKLRVSPANLTASEQPVTQPIYKKVNLATFGEWCFAFEPESISGQFTSVENILVPPKAGFSLYVQNYNPASEAIYHVKTKMWASC